jgi:glucokinase
MTSIPVLEIGGTHVTAARVDAGQWRTVPGSRHRLPLDSAGTAEDILSAIVSCASLLGPLDGSVLGVAIPGPFDYRLGLGRFSGVGKFDALNGVDVRTGLLAALPHPPKSVRFLNDAEAFALGEWVAGAACGYDRVTALTVGTGIGSAFLESGRIVTNGATVPPEGRVDLLRVGDASLEDVVSRRAILADYARRSAVTGLDVADIAKRARAGEPAARDVFETACAALGAVIAPWIRRFGAQVLVVGGTIAASWDLVGPPLQAAIGDIGIPAVRARDLEEAAEIGTAWHIVSSETEQ